jgi:hypothetical protein
MTASTPLAFSLLAPAFAGAGLLLASIPIIIHILNRRRFKTVDWAAMSFLLRAMRKNRQRVRFEQWLLLAARCCVLAFLGLALARPMGCDSNSAAALGGRTGLHVFVIDNSYSMSYLAGRPDGKTHLDQAKLVAGQMIDKLGSSGESVVIITAGKPAVGVIGKPTYDLQQARAILNRIPQTYGATDLPAALRLAIEVGRENESQPNKNLYLFTDATASAWQGSDANALKTEGPELARLFDVSHFNLALGPQWNQAVLDVHPSANLITTNSVFSSDFIATVKGFGSPHEGTLQWKMDGQLLGGGGKLNLDTNTPVQNEPQSNLQLALRGGGIGGGGNGGGGGGSSDAGAAGGPHAITASIIGDDGLQVDNTRTRIINVVSRLKTLIVEGQHSADAVGGSGLNLKVALEGLSKSGASDGFAAPDLISDLELGNHVLTDYRAVILCEVSQVTPAEADQLQTFVKNGGTLMVFLGDNISQENYNTVMLPRHLIPGTLTKRVLAPEGGSFYFDFNPNSVLHPLLKAFEHQQKTGLETAQAFGYWQVDVPMDPDLRVLNWKAPEGTRVDPNARPDAAITQQSLGQGRVVFVSTAANEPWITFTRKPVYTELVNELLSGSVNVGDSWMNLTVGDSLSVPTSLKLTTAPTLTDPKSTPIPLELTTAVDGSASYRSPVLTLPGVYSLATGTTTVPIAVNVPAEEADVHTIDDTALKAALGGIPIRLNNDQPIAAFADSANAADWGWTVMLAVLGLVGFESFLAMAFGHYRKQTGIPAAA